MLLLSLCVCFVSVLTFVRVYISMCAAFMCVQSHVYTNVHVLIEGTVHVTWHTREDCVHTMYFYVCIIHVAVCIHMYNVHCANVYMCMYD